MSDIFISYSSENKSETEKLAIALESQGWSVWWDRSIPVGKRYEIIIEEALDEAKCVIVVWSKQSVKSQWVRAEAAEAQSQGKLFPLNIDGSNPPLIYRALQTADFVNWSGEVSASVFKRIADDIGNHIGKPAIQVKSISVSQKEERKQEQIKHKEIQQKKVELERKKQQIVEEELKQEKIKQEQLKAKQNATKKVSETPVEVPINKQVDKKNSNKKINTDTKLKQQTAVQKPQIKQRRVGILFVALMLIPMIYFLNQSYQKKVELETFRKITQKLASGLEELSMLEVNSSEYLRRSKEAIKPIKPAGSQKLARDYIVNPEFKGSIESKTNKFLKRVMQEMESEIELKLKEYDEKKLILNPYIKENDKNNLAYYIKRLKRQIKSNETAIQEIEALAVFNDNSVESENMRVFVKNLKKVTEDLKTPTKSLNNVLNTMHQGAMNSIRNIRQ